MSRAGGATPHRAVVLGVVFCNAWIACVACSADEKTKPAPSCDAGLHGEPGPICNGAEVFVAYCSGGVCHHSGCDPARGLDLQSPDVAGRIIGVESSCSGRLYIDPNDVDRSFLLEKLQSDMPECGGSKMPLIGTSLSPEVIQCIRDWIVAELR